MNYELTRKIDGGLHKLYLYAKIWSGECLGYISTSLRPNDRVVINNFLSHREGQGVGTTLLHAGMVDARNMGRLDLHGEEFQPLRMSRHETKEWYQKRGVEIVRGQVAGILDDIIAKCDQILVARGVTYTVQDAK